MNTQSVTDTTKQIVALENYLKKYGSTDENKMKELLESHQQNDENTKESDSDSEDREPEKSKGPALPNTLSTILDIFPLTESRQKRVGIKRARSKDPISTLEAKKDQGVTTPNNLILPNQLEAVLFPSEEDLLGDSMARVNIEGESVSKKRKIDTLSANGLLQRIQSGTKPTTLSVSASTFANFRSQLTSKQNKKNKLQSHSTFEESKGTLSMQESNLPEKIHYTYMVPNEFHVRMVAPYTLFDYQIEAVKWMVDLEENKTPHPCYQSTSRGGLLAMAMGLGKTPTACTLIARTLMRQRTERSCTLYICPKNLLGTVRFQIEKFFGDQIRVLIYHRDFLRSEFNVFDSAEIRKYDVIISNYSTIVSRMVASSISIAKPPTKRKKKQPKDAFMEESPSTQTSESELNHLLNSVKHQVNTAADSFARFPWFRIILDESQEIREKGTKRFRAVMALTSPRKFCITGTPIYNKIADIYHQLEFTGLQIAKGTKYTKNNLKMLNLYKVIRFVEYKDAESVKLPPKQIHKIFFQLSTQEKFLHTFYMRTAQKIFKEIHAKTGHEKTKKNIEAHMSMVRLMQVCTAPYLITPAAKMAKAAIVEVEDEEGDMEDDVEVPPAIVFPTNDRINEWIQERSGTAGMLSSKMQKFIELMQTLKDEATPNNPLKVVVFANYTSTLRLAVAAMQKHDETHEKRHVMVYGGISSAHKKEELYTRFRVQPQIEILYMTLKLGAVGLNLSEANKVIFLEPWYSFSALSQGESRVHRIGQMRPVDIYYLLAADSAEERVFRTADAKKELAKDVASHQEKKLELNDMQYILFQDMETS
jgi:SNF2 family DNA or RNA helicase